MSERMVENIDLREDSIQSLSSALFALRSHRHQVLVVTTFDVDRKEFRVASYASSHHMNAGLLD